MKRILSIITILTLFVGNVSSQTESRHKFLNPEYRWVYNEVSASVSDYSEIHLYPMELKIVGAEQRNGKDYCKLSWTAGKQEQGLTDLSYFLVREDNGAWYTYVDYSEDAKPSDIPVEPGEYLLYDFNLESGSTLDVPASCFFYGVGADIEDQSVISGMGIVHFIVKSKDVDEYDRRVLTLIPDNKQENFWGCIPNEVKVVEGVGPLDDGNLAMYFFPEYTTGSRDPHVEFLEILDNDGQVIYMDPAQRSAGFLDSMDYTWIYGVYDSEGEVSYLKMSFNYHWTYRDYQTGTEFSHRTFRITGKSDSPDGPWKDVDLPYFNLREDKEKVWLLFFRYSYDDIEEPDYKAHMIYDYGAEDGSELTFYSPEGEQTRRITTGFTEVGGEPRRSYTFDGSDGVTCVEGIGIIKGGILPVVNGEFRLPGEGEEDTYVGAALVAVCDGDGNLIFRQDMPSIVEEIPASADGYTAPSDRIYDLQGRELRSPIPGQPYIQGGKIHSGRKYE